MMSITNKSIIVDCHYAECRYAEYRHAECHYAEWRGAISTTVES
jgi:hypothetical protein